MNGNCRENVHYFWKKERGTLKREIIFLNFHYYNVIKGNAIPFKL